MRWWTALLFAGVGGYTLWHNSQDTGKYFLFPFLYSMFPDLQRDPYRAGQVSGWLFFGIAGVFLVRDLFRAWQDRTAGRVTMLP